MSIARTRQRPDGTATAVAAVPATPAGRLGALGFVHWPGAVSAACVAQAGAQADPAAQAMDEDDAGTRDLLAHPACAALVAPLRRRLAGVGALDRDAVAVQCTLFRKSGARNWKVGWHQDLCVPVAGRVECAQLSGWSRKQGVDFVQPPAELLERLTIVRLHLDPCESDDGPLRVVPASHRHGRLGMAQARALRARSGEVECSAQPGDLLIMRPLLLHASSKAARPQGRRRVLHFLFGPREPGYGLRWSMTI
ncbi:phytanoyl-CoA dioxygenase family protein [Lysobacter antibioticus]|uniref:phytanoyl-CoA dioxygenase family protein n=1 Tax=Lysobacter antibioticus TaxID=84531 RepID=UPI001C9565B3|nr:phytanoyl-CoA dioxygenase family protein [Lysobacter antibioticus]